MTSHDDLRRSEYGATNAVPFLALARPLSGFEYVASLTVSRMLLRVSQARSFGDGKT